MSRSATLDVRYRSSPQVVRIWLGHPTILPKRIKGARLAHPQAYGNPPDSTSPGHALAEVNKHSDLGHVRVRKLQVYLMNWSDRVLSDCSGDPKAALDLLAGKVLLMMGTSEMPFDDGAVRYYLIDQLIACNVFPNKRTPDA